MVGPGKRASTARGKSMRAEATGTAANGRFSKSKLHSAAGNIPPGRYRPTPRQPVACQQSDDADLTKDDRATASYRLSDQSTALCRWSVGATIRTRLTGAVLTLLLYDLALVEAVGLSPFLFHANV